MREPTFLILTALAGEPLHGYAILTEVERLSRTSSGGTTLRVGTLYTALDRLAGEGLVEVESEEVVQGRLRRTYRLTGAGREALRVQAERLEALAGAARRRLQLPGAPGVTGAAGAAGAGRSGSLLGAWAR